MAQFFKNEINILEPKSRMIAIAMQFLTNLHHQIVSQFQQNLYEVY